MPTLQSLIFLDISQLFKPFRSLSLNLKTHVRLFLVLEIIEGFVVGGTLSLSLLLSFLVNIHLNRLPQRVTLVYVGHF